MHKSELIMNIALFRRPVVVSSRALNFYFVYAAIDRVAGLFFLFFIDSFFDLMFATETFLTSRAELWTTLGESTLSWASLRRQQNSEYTYIIRE